MTNFQKDDEEDNEMEEIASKEVKEGEPSQSALSKSTTTTHAMATPTLSKSWTVASAHVPIYTGGKVVPCHFHRAANSQNNSSSNEEDEDDDDMEHDQISSGGGAISIPISCLLLPVNGDVVVVDAQRGIKLGSVREGNHSGSLYKSGIDEDDDEDGIDADAITAYALSSSTNPKVLVTCSHNHLVRQYSIQTVVTYNTNNITGNNESEPGETTTTETETTAISVQLDKTWGRSGHSLPVTELEFHCSNVFVASGSVDGTVRVWDVRGGHVTHIFRPLAGGSGGGSGRLSVTCIRWMENIKNLILAIGRDDGSIAIHDLRDQVMKQVVVLRDHLSAITCMDWWSKEGVRTGDLLSKEQDSKTAYPSMFVTASRDAVLNLWSIDQSSSSSSRKNTTSKKKAKNLKSKSAGEFASSMVSARTYRRKHTLPLYEQIEGMVVLQDENDDGTVIIATAGSKGIVRLWKSFQSDDGDIVALSMCSEQPSSQAYGETSGGYLGMYSMKMPNSSGKHIMKNELQLIVADGEHCLSFLSLDDSTEGSLAADRTIVGYNDEVLDLKVIPALEANSAPSQIVVATNSAQVRIFSLGNFSCHVLDGHSATVLCVDVSPCGRFIATSGKDKKMCIWHTQSRKRVATAVGHTEAVGAAALSRKPGRYDVGGKAAKNCGGAFAVTVSLDRTLKRWNLPGSSDLGACAKATGTEEIHLEAFVSTRAHEKDINVVSVAPNDSFIATGSQDKTVKLWRSTDLNILATLKGHRRGVWDVSFSKVDRVIATASGDCSIRLWSLSDFTCVRTFQGHVASVLRVRFLNGGLQLVSSGADGLIKLWTIRTNECEATLDGHHDKVWALDVAPTGTSMISGGADSQLLVWKDTTRATEDAKRAEREEAILMDQRLANHLRHKEFSQALDIALKIDKPRLTLKVLTSIIEADMKEQRSPIASLQQYIPKWNLERVAQVLGYCREWNTRARNCDVAMLVIRAIVSVMPAEDLAAIDGIPEILAGVTPYAERHFERLDRLVASSYLLDFALFSMGSLDTPDEKEFVNWELQSKLVLPPASIDGKTQVGGKAVVGGNGRVGRNNNSDDDEVSTVGDSDSSGDEDDNEEVVRAVGDSAGNSDASSESSKSDKSDSSNKEDDASSSDAFSA